MSKTKIVLMLVLAVVVAAFFIFDLGQYLSLEAMKAQQQRFADYYQQQPLQTALIYFGAYVAIAALSLPGAALITLLGGALFGLGWGTLLVSFASTVGATLAFLISRFVLRDVIQSRFGDRLAAVNSGIEKDGAFYLFTLRLVPAFPFFIVNLVMGLTLIRTLTFYLASQLGMLPGTVVFVNAGTQLGQLDSLSGILSPGLIFSFVLLGLFPLIAKKLLGFFSRGGTADGASRANTDSHKDSNR